jgi:cytochrome P450
MTTLTTTPSVRTIAIASLALYIAYRIGARLQLAARRRAMIRENGCQPPVDLDSHPSRKAIANRYWPYDRIFGLNLGNMKFISDLQKQHKLYPSRMDLWAAVAPSKTCRTHLVNNEWMLTQDVENIKYVMATDFDNWAFVPGREHGLGQFLGKGIFTTDGAAWAHSRNLLKPNFTRFQISNMALFERHFQELLAVIPRDGSTINLGPRFFCMTMGHRYRVPLRVLL